MPNNQTSGIPPKEVQDAIARLFLNKSAASTRINAEDIHQDELQIINDYIKRIHGDDCRLLAIDGCGSCTTKDGRRGNRIYYHNCPEECWAC